MTRKEKRTTEGGHGAARRGRGGGAHPLLPIYFEDYLNGGETSNASRRCGASRSSRPALRQKTVIPCVLNLPARLTTAITTFTADGLSENKHLVLHFNIYCIKVFSKGYGA